MNYHFGNKDGLLQAIVLSRGQPMNDERVRMLELAEQAAGAVPPTVEAIMRAFIEPVLRMKVEYPHFPRLLGRVMTENLMPVVGEVFQSTFYQTLMRFAHALTKALPDIPLEEIRWRLFFTIGAFHFCSLGEESISCASQGEVPRVTVEELTEHLVAYSSAGMRTPVPSRGGTS